MNMPIQIWASIGLLVFYTVFHVYDDISRYSTRTYIINKRIESLRSKYNVTIRTFRVDKPLYGFAWFRSIWINEKILNIKNEKALNFIFHHEHYHLKKKHKLCTLFIRFLISITPLLCFFVYWWATVIILLSMAYLSSIISKTFEKKAHDYAQKIVNE